MGGSICLSAEYGCRLRHGHLFDPRDRSIVIVGCCKMDGDRRRRRGIVVGVSRIERLDFDVSIVDGI
jgi:hypothetical protein